MSDDTIPAASRPVHGAEQLAVVEFFSSYCAFSQQYGIDKGIRAVFEQVGVSGEEYDRMMDSILVKARAAEMRQLFVDYKVTGTPAVYVNGQHINNSDFRGETPEGYRQEYVAAVEKLLKTGG